MPRVPISTAMPQRNLVPVVLYTAEPARLPEVLEALEQNWLYSAQKMLSPALRAAHWADRSWYMKREPVLVLLPVICRP